MKYTELSEEQRQDIATYAGGIAGLMSALCGVAKTVSPTTHAWSLQHIDPALASLDAGEKIPNPTALAGAKSISVEELIVIRDMSRGLLALLQDPAKQAALSKLIGINL